MNCSVCHKPVLDTESSIDHIRPGKFGGINHTIVHVQCNRHKLTLRQRIMRWAGRKLMEAQLRRDARKLNEACYKTSMGYRCKHEMHDGVKECGGPR